ncbi:MAG: hypothetical protein Q4F81_12905 [Eubacteriales bacterium]|nr:hypothetical protein [Eubacteriales bacterium]
MTFDSTLEALAGQLPSVMTQAASYIPDELSDVIWHARSYLPVEVDLMSAAQFMLYFSAISLILGVMGRLVLGKRSSLNSSVSSAMGILFIYALTVVIYTFRPWNLDALLSPLPFATFTGEYLILLPITDVQFPALCAQVLSLVVLAFLMNLVDTFMPKGKNILTWLLLRILTLAVCMGLHLVVNWAFRTYLPNVLVTYAPMVLLLILCFCLLSGVVNLLLGMVIAVANPFLGAMYTFFFSTVVGKQVSKAIFSSAIICAVMYLLDLFGYTVISICAASLATYIPLALILLVLWYLIGSVL